MQYALFYFFILTGLGTAFGSAARIDYPVAAAVVFLIASWAWVCRRFDRIFVPLMVLFSFAFGILIYSGSGYEARSRLWDDWTRRERPQNQIAEIRGEVVSGIKSYVNHHDETVYNYRLRLDGGSDQIKVVSPHPDGVRYGDLVRAAGDITRPPGRTNPVRFDYKAYLKNSGCYGILEAEEFTILGRAGGIRSLPIRVKNAWIGLLDRAFADEESGLFKAILLGERQGMDEEFKDALSATGTFHLFAISGLHVGILASIFYGLLSVLRFPGRTRTVVLAAILIFYCVLTGGKPPVFRATVMACALLAAHWTRRPILPLNALSAAGILILVMNPLELFSAGFQLSFAAVFGMILLVPRFDKPAGMLKTLAAVSLIAWAVTSPLVIQHFNQLSIVAPGINILLIPMTYVMILLLVVFSLSALTPLGQAGFWVPLITAAAKTMTGMIDVAENLPVTSVWLSSWNSVTWTFFIAGTVILFLCCNLKSKRVKLAGVLLIFLNSVLLNQSWAVAAAKPLTVTFFDVGQGDSALIEFGGKGAVLVDTGRGGANSAFKRTLLPYLKSRGLRTLDAVMISHPQYDHSGGMDAILRTLRVSRVYDNGDRSEAEYFKNYVDRLKAVGVSRAVIASGDEIRVRSAFTIKVLYPDEHHDELSLNNRSVVFLLEGMGRRILFTGDLEGEGMEKLFPYLSGVSDIDVLKVPHHGAEMDERAVRMLRKIKPRYSVISAGRGNRYGHPHGSALDALDALGGTAFRTDRDGAVRCVITGPGPGGNAGADNLVCESVGSASDAASVPDPAAVV